MTFPSFEGQKVKSATARFTGVLDTHDGFDLGDEVYFIGRGRLARIVHGERLLGKEERVLNRGQIIAVEEAFIGDEVASYVEAILDGERSDEERAAAGGTEPMPGISELTRTAPASMRELVESTLVEKGIHPPEHAEHVSEIIGRTVRGLTTLSKGEAQTVLAHHGADIYEMPEGDLASDPEGDGE